MIASAPSQPRNYQQKSRMQGERIVVPPDHFSPSRPVIAREQFIVNRPRHEEQRISTQARLQLTQGSGRAAGARA